MATQAKDSNFRDQFWAKVDRTDDLFSCWLWQGKKNSGGYGASTWLHPVVGRSVTDVAHRIAHFLVHQELPECVRHTCDTPACVRPEHLVGGTQADNIRDAQIKGRLHRGPRRRFTAEEVRDIRHAISQGASEVELAAQYGVRLLAISRLTMGRTYKSFPGPIRNPRRTSRGPRKNRSTNANTRTRGRCKQLGTSD